MMDILSDALQSAIYARLSSDADLAAIVGSHVYDAMPAGPVPDAYVLIGEEVVTDASDKLAHGARHDLVISVISGSDGFLTLKQGAAAIVAALDAPGLVLSRGSVSGFWFIGATSKRTSSGPRRIDLKFRARLDT